MPPLHRSLRTLAIVLAASAFAAVWVWAQTPSSPPGGTPKSSPWGGAQPLPPGTTIPQSGTRASGTPTGVTRVVAPANAPPVIARVEGRPITQREWDRVATPYFAQLKAQLGDRFGEVQATAKQNVLNELIRQQVVTLEAQRQKIEVSEKETDEVLKRDAFFMTNGKFDEAKFAEFKRSPTSNYAQMLPQVREMVAMSKLDARLRERFTPSHAAVREEWSKRNDQVRLDYFLLQARDLSLDPEASEAERNTYYRAHPEEFTRKARLRFRYFKLPLPAIDDSTRAAAEAAATRRARGLADSLTARTLPDSARGMLDTGLFEVPALTVPGLGRIPELCDALGRADTVRSVRVVGPYTGTEAVVVGVVVGRAPKGLAPLREVLADLKRRADVEKRRQALEAEQQTFYRAHPDSFRSARARVTRLTLGEPSANLEPPRPAEIEQWYRAHGHSLFGRPDSSRAWIPALDDSLRGRVRRRIEQERREAWLHTTLEKLVTGARATRDPRGLARANGAVAETLTLVRHGLPDSLFPGGLVDSIVTGSAGPRGEFLGPRRYGRYAVLWRVDAVDTAFVAAYETVRPRVQQMVAEERRRKDEDEGRAYYDQHRSEYNLPLKYVIDYVAVAIPLSDSIHLPESELRADYERNKARFVEEEQLRARHILIKNADGTTAGEARAKARADSLYDVIKKGVDFVDLVERFSEDAGTAPAGGDLGWFGRGRMVKEFEQAAFALAKGEVSAPVKTRFGYHIIRLDDRQAGRTRPFEEVRREIFYRLAAARGDSTAHRVAAALGRRLAAGGDARALSAAHGGIKTCGPFAATEPAPGLGFVDGLAGDIARLVPGKWSSRAYRAGIQYLTVRVKERQPPRPGSFEEMKAKAVGDAREARRKELLARRVGELRSAFAAGAALDSVATLFGGLKQTTPFPQSYGFVPGLGYETSMIRSAFSLPLGQLSDTLQTAQGVVWIRVAEKTAGKDEDFRTAEAQLSQELVTRSYSEWVEARKKSMKIEILRADLRPAPRAGITSGG